jgi:phosphotransferase system enzyme I (PtsI)
MAGTRLSGVAASEGVAVGPVFVHLARELKPERETISRARSRRSWGASGPPSRPSRRSSSATAEKMREGGSEKEAGIFEAHAEMAETPSSSPRSRNACAVSRAPRRP